VIGFRKSHAVVVGIDDYGHGIPALRTAVNDARRIAAVLEQDFEYEVKLLDKDATLGRLRTLFDEALPREIEADDRLLVYFAGHGVALDGDDGPAGYLVPQDARRDDRSSFLPMTELSACLERLPCRHLLLVLDCCFAGAFRWSSTRDLGGLPDVIHRERFDRYIRDPAWQVLTSSAYDQKALDVLAGETIGVRGREMVWAAHSPFAAALLKALKGEADLVPAPKDGRPGGDGVITATELYLYLREAVESGAEGSGHRQTPGLWPLRRHDKGEFIHLTPGHELKLPPAPPLDEANNPYRGLESYDEVHAPLFFGRSKFVEVLAERVRAQPLTIVLGASGTGKSSVVKAGLLPFLRASEPGSWEILPPIRPGKSPMTPLSLLPIPHESTEDAGATLARRVGSWTAGGGGAPGRLLIVVDQFEELLTLCADPRERESFLDQLQQALQTHPDRLRIVLTLRSDFEPQFSDSPLHNDWMAARVVVPAWIHQEYREAIEGPALARVVYFEGLTSSQSFIDRLIGDVANTPGALPLLSFTLSELYRRYLACGSGDRSLSERNYEALGGVGGSLRNRVDEVYNGLPDDEHRLALRRVMLRMVSVEGGELARRRVPDDELIYEHPHENAQVAEVLRRLTDARLVVEGKDDGDRPYVEPAHDALIRGWGRLLDWSRDGLEELQLRRRLTPAAREWSGGRGGLWIIEPRLGVLKQELSRPGGWLNRDEAHFVRRSLAGRRNAIAGAFGAAALLASLLMVAGYFLVRFVRNLPIERLEAARVALDSLGFRVSDENRDNYIVIWDAGEQGPLSDDAWLRAAGPLKVLDRDSSIASLQLIYTDVGDLKPLAGLASVKHLKVLGSRADDLSPIKDLVNLEILELSGFKTIDDDDLKIFQMFTRLRNLDLLACEGLKADGMRHLAKLPVRALALSDCKGIDNTAIIPLCRSSIENLMINRTSARVDRELVDRLLSFPRLSLVDVGGLPADPEELARLRKNGASQGLQVSPKSALYSGRPRPSNPYAASGPGASSVKKTN